MKSIDVKKGVNLYSIHHNLKPGIYYLKIDKEFFQGVHKIYSIVT